MLSSRIVQIIRELLAAGLSHYAIARQTRVSRGRIVLIAHDKRPDYEAIRRQSEEESHGPVGPKLKCPTCGDTVYLPCIACRARRARVASRVIAPWACRDDHGEPLRLNLKERHRERYESIRRRPPWPGRQDSDHRT